MLQIYSNVMLSNSLGKKAEVSLRLFDLFQRYMVFIFFWKFRISTDQLKLIIKLTG